MKASRHPQLSRASLDRVLVMIAPMPEASRTPAPTDTCCQEPAKARRRGAADSTRKAEEEPNSPPAAKPWTIRAITRMIGDRMPTVS